MVPVVRREAAVVGVGTAIVAAKAVAAVAAEVAERAAAAAANHLPANPQTAITPSVTMMRIAIATMIMIVASTTTRITGATAQRATEIATNHPR
jgi:hypothetical protein